MPTPWPVRSAERKRIVASCEACTLRHSASCSATCTASCSAACTASLGAAAAPVAAAAPKVAAPRAGPKVARWRSWTMVSVLTPSSSKREKKRPVALGARVAAAHEQHALVLVAGALAHVPAVPHLATEALTPLEARHVRLTVEARRHHHPSCQVGLARHIGLHAPRVRGRGGGALRAVLERRDAPAEAKVLLQPVRLSVARQVVAHVVLGLEHRVLAREAAVVRQLVVRTVQRQLLVTTHPEVPDRVAALQDAHLAV
eukprot:scaffold40591_cov56-Phaeocystis_antarctica.AAC.3